MQPFFIFLYKNMSPFQGSDDSRIPFHRALPCAEICKGFALLG